MATIRRKTQKKFGKQVKKLVKQYGPEAALGAATALVNTIIDQATEKPAKKSKKEKPAKKEKPSKKEKPAKKESKGDAPKGGKPKGASKKSKKAAPAT